MIACRRLIFITSFSSKRVLRSKSEHIARRIPACKKRIHSVQEYQHESFNEIFRHTVGKSAPVIKEPMPRSTYLIGLVRSFRFFPGRRQKAESSSIWIWDRHMGSGMAAAALPVRPRAPGRAAEQLPHLTGERAVSLGLLLEIEFCGGRPRRPASVAGPAIHQAIHGILIAACERVRKRFQT